MDEPVEVETPAATTSSLGSPLTWLVLGGVGALLVYQLAVRPDEGERTVRKWLANQ